MSTASTTLSRAQQAKLAAEILASQPPKEWDQIPELSPKKFKGTVTLKNGEQKEMTFAELVGKSLDLKSEIEYRERIRKEIQMHLEAAMLLSDEKTVMCDGYPINYVTRSGSRKIIAEKLLENGVSAQVIAASTETSPESHFVQIGKPKKEY